MKQSYALSSPLNPCSTGLIQEKEEQARPSKENISFIHNFHIHNIQGISQSSMQFLTCMKYICITAWRSGCCSMTSRSMLLTAFLQFFSSFRLRDCSSKVSLVVFLLERISLLSLEDCSRNK